MHSPEHDDTTWEGYHFQAWDALKEERADEALVHALLAVSKQLDRIGDALWSIEEKLAIDVCVAIEGNQ